MAGALLGVLNGCLLLAWLVCTVQAGRFRRSVFRLDRVPAQGPESLPRLSVVVAARDEEGSVERAMRSLLAADYPDLEIVGVDDRSTDGTGAILDRLAAQDARLRVVHVRELPPGWLGKNHALHVGSARATGEFLLFTDADVHFEPTALRRAVGHTARAGLDHFVLLPEMVLGGFWERLLAGFFSAMFVLRFEVWKVNDPASPAHVGVGAFNLVRAGAYRRAGGHAALPMDVLDDVKLGKRMKESGGRTACGLGWGLVRVRWAVGARGILDNLEKNAFAAFGFRPALALLGVAGTLFACLWPVAGLWVGPWGARLACAGAIACMVVLARAAPPGPGFSPAHGAVYPLASLLFCYAILRSMLVTYRHGGIVWRGTLYPLDALRRGVV
jgi:glycosyltransferase involved in cell wall biosynthesis